MDRFVKIISQEVYILYADWTTYTVQWLTQKPDHITFESTINWRYDKTQKHPKTIIICGNDNTLMPHIIPRSSQMTTGSSDIGLPLLKSHLQKCVRRGLSELAVQTAKEIILSDINTFLRRLAVIMIEDVCLHESLSHLVWLTAACSKGYKIRTDQLNWLLGIVDYLCRESSVETSHNTNVNTIDDKILIQQLMNQRSPINDILLSLMFRISYGGMKCDINMFRQCVIHRLKSPMPKHILNTQIIPVDSETIKPLQKTTMIINSVDYHCFPHLLTDIQHKFPQYDIDDIKHSVWECNSCTNYRKPQQIADNLQQIWTHIQTYVTQRQQYYLNFN